MENIALAHNNARKHKAHYTEVKEVNASSARYFRRIHTMLKYKTFQNSEYEVFTKVANGKEREIFKLPYYPDRIIHHCIMNVMEPIWIKTLIADTYSSLKNRGIHKGVRRIKTALQDTVNTQYCLKVDVRKFYPSIDHDILKKILRQKVKDTDLLWLLDKIIDSAVGVPIGNYLSQYFGNMYLSSLDHWAKEKKKCKYYFRYCDDIVVLSGDKQFLSELRKEMANYLGTVLNVHLKDNWQVFPTSVRGVDFLGYRFFHDYTLLRKSTAKQFKKRINTISKSYSSMNTVSMLSSIMSYWGWMKHADCYRLHSKYVNEKVLRIARYACDRDKIHNPLECVL